MHRFLVVQAQYQNYEVGLYNELHRIDYQIHDKKDASSSLIPTIQSILSKNSISIHEINAIGVNQGPGQFTSLRIIITTVNGIAFATDVPLIGCNSLEALLLEYKNNQFPLTIALLNACNNDVYYAFKNNTGALISGCLNIKQLLEQLQQDYTADKLEFIGNGAIMHRDLIQQFFGSPAYISQDCIEEASLDQIAQITIQKFQEKKEFSSQLLPIYLKDVNYATTQLRQS